MASLLENLKKNMTLDIDKGNVEIQKKVAKKKSIFSCWGIYGDSQNGD